MSDNYDNNDFDDNSDNHDNDGETITTIVGWGPVMTPVNPFKPSAGAEPPVLVGRDEVLRDFEEGLLSGVGAPGRLMRITGPRGSGKTVLLTELGDIARKHGWDVVDETARAGLAEEIRRRLTDVREANVSVEVNLAVVKAGAEKPVQTSPANLREALDRRVIGLTKQGRGLLITIDEVQNAALEDINKIAIAVQHLVREKKNIAFVFAGITSGVLSLLGENGPTFLRRAYPEELDTIPSDDISLALRATIEQSGLEISEASLHKATEATAGYAYLIQLVGFHIWRAARAHADISRAITGEDVERGIKAARDGFNRAVLETALAGLTKSALEFLLAMTEDPLASSTGEIAKRLGMSGSAATTPRRQLIERQIIEPTARGYVAFSIPFMREYLIGHRAELLARYGVEA